MSEFDGPIFHGQIKNRSVGYFECRLCGYVQTEQPTWLDEAYASPVNISDTGIIARNQANISLVLATLVLLGQKHGKVVDYAGGFGFLVRMLRDIGVDAYWTDPYTDNLVARGFEYRDGNAELVMAFEAFEHFVDPLAEVESLLAIAPNLLFTTDLIPTPTPLPSDWWYYGLDHGQHIGFFRHQTLQHIAGKYGKFLLTDGTSTHLLLDQKASISRWLLIRKIARVSPALLALGLCSKTWDDHLFLSCAAQDNESD
ncbi:class I SAM-dependent methyltransferase [Haliea sp.]